ncbi:MAG: hypothetical protein HC921_13290 [Synechococcaceae cyanobacterium SM2_3_1]|nr:hypothetical protein [Synechococcaceae cyanobacterium SM2_3_1]
MSIPPMTVAIRQLLTEALQISRELFSGMSLEPAVQSRRQERLRQLQAQLQTYAHPLNRDLQPIAEIPLAVRQAFVRSVMLVSRYHQLAGCRWRGSLLSPTLSQYRPDPIPPPLQQPDALAHLARLFALPETDYELIADQIQVIDRRITRQKQIMQAVLQSLGGSHSWTAAQSLQVFQAIFGPLPLPPQVLNWVYTDTQLYFCLDYEQDQLQPPELWASLSKSDRQQIRGFLDSLATFQFQKFKQFPIFGPCQPQHVDPQWCEQVASLSGVSAADVREALSRSVSVLPTAKAEAFLLHDIWGHYWQWILTGFASDYALLTTCADPLRGAETAYTPEGPLACWQLFYLQHGSVGLDEERTRLFFQGEVQQRLGFLFTHLLGELIADIAEFKFIADHPQSAEQLPSSSIFKQHAAKLDLSLADIDFLFLKIMQPLLDVHISVMADSTLESDLLAHWRFAQGQEATLSVRTSLKQAVIRMHQLFLESYAHTYLPSITTETSMFTTIVANLVCLQNAVNTLCQEAQDLQPPVLPFRDLLLVFIGSYCSSDSFNEFWAIDNVLASDFLPCWRWLQPFGDCRV